MSRRLEIRGVDGIPEVQAGDDLAELIARAAPDLRDGDIVVVTSKVVSKAEGRVVAMDRESAIDAETVRVVAARGATRIVQTRHGLVLAAAGVDASNVAAGTVALLPLDPDASARGIRTGLRAVLGVDVAVVVTDTLGRPWRNGLVDVAIGAAGMAVVDDHRGRTDRHGHTLEMTVTAVADEVAAAAELVKGKLDQVPVAIVRGLAPVAPDPDEGARSLLRAPADDMFRLGTREAMRAALFAVSDDEPQTDPIANALAAADAAPSPDATRSWRLVRDGDDIVVGYVSDDLDAAAATTAVIGLGAAIAGLVLALAVDGVRTTWQQVDPAEPVTAPTGWRAVALVRLGR